MLRLILTLTLVLCIQHLPASAWETFTYRTVHTGLEIPWEIEFGPDSTLWTTERIGLMSPHRSGNR